MFISKKKILDILIEDEMELRRHFINVSDSDYLSGYLFALKTIKEKLKLKN